MIPRNAPGGHAIDHMRLLAIDSIRSHIYIAPMAEDANVMFEHELKRLEKRVDALVQVCDQRHTDLRTRYFAAKK